MRLPGPERKKLLRSLQLEWHPDKRQYGSEAEREVLTELAMKINEAMRVAKENMRLRGEL